MTKSVFAMFSKHILERIQNRKCNFFITMKEHTFLVGAFSAFIIEYAWYAVTERYLP